MEAVSSRNLAVERVDSALALQDDMHYLRLAMTEQNPDVERACLFPRYEQIALFMHQNPHHSLASALQAFAGK